MSKFKPPNKAAQALLQHREKHGLTLKDVAVELGTTQVTVCRLEQGTEPRLRLAIRVSEYLGIPISAFLEAAK